MASRRFCCLSAKPVNVCRTSSNITLGSLVGFTKGFAGGSASVGGLLAQPGNQSGVVSSKAVNRRALLVVELLGSIGFPFPFSGLRLGGRHLLGGFALRAALTFLVPCVEHGRQEHKNRDD